MTKDSASRLLTPRCSKCDVPTAEIELSESSGEWHLKYSGPGGSKGGVLAHYVGAKLA